MQDLFKSFCCEARAVAYCNDRLVPLAELGLSLMDLGFIHGVTVAEQVRTFGNKPFLLEEHFRRWCGGLKLLGLRPPCDFAELHSRIQRLIERNAILTSGRQQGITFLATPGARDVWESSSPPKPLVSATFYAYSYPLSAASWSDNYRLGVRLVATDIQDVSPASWPKHVKIRSRLHYYLAQAQVGPLGADVYPLLLDQAGYVSDSAIASIVGWSSNEGLIVRPESDRYDSISVGYLQRLATNLGLPIVERYFTVQELAGFSEAFLVSTPWCLFPVRQARQSTDFPIFRLLVQAWQENVGEAIVF